MTILMGTCFINLKKRFPMGCISTYTSSKSDRLKNTELLRNKKAGVFIYQKFGTTSNMEFVRIFNHLL